MVESHEDTSTTLGGGTLTTQALDFAIGVNLIVFEDGHLDLLALVLDLLGGVVSLLLALLSTTTQTKNEVQSRLLLDVVVGESAAVLELLSSENQPLLIWGDTFFILDLGLDIVDSVRGLDLKGDCLTRKGFYENLHAAKTRILLSTERSRLSNK